MHRAWQGRLSPAHLLRGWLHRNKNNCTAVMETGRYKAKCYKQNGGLHVLSFLTRTWEGPSAPSKVPPFCGQTQRCASSSPCTLRRDVVTEGEEIRDWFASVASVAAAAVAAAATSDSTAAGSGSPACCHPAAGGRVDSVLTLSVVFQSFTLYFRSLPIVACGAKCRRRQRCLAGSNLTGLASGPVCLAVHYQQYE